MRILPNLSLLSLFLISLFSSNLQATDLACNGSINVSLDENCFAEVTADMMLEGIYPDIDSYIVSFTESGDSPVYLDGSMIGQTISISVTDPVSGNYCWGEILVEDKLAPQPICVDVIVACFESTEVGDIPYPLVNDNCSAYVDSSYTDSEVDYGCSDPDYIKTIFRLWSFTDEGGNIGTCTQQINVLRGDFSSINFPPNYDNIDLDALSCDGIGWDTNGNNYPDINETGEPGGTSCSNIISSYEDTEVPICESSYKVLREWTIQNWCTSQIITHFQVIKILGNGPSIIAGADVTIDAESTICSANYNVPNPSISYTCNVSGPLPGYSVSVNAGNVIQNGSNWVITALPVGTHEVTLTVEDGCGNIDTDTFIISVIDNTPPIAICDQHTTVSLTTSNTNPEGIAKVFAQTFDDGSYDNCGPVYLKVRRMNTGACDALNGDDFPSIPGYQESYDDYAGFCCDDETVMVILRVYDVNPGVGPVEDSRHEINGDLYGHFNDCMIEISVQDKIAPVMLCPDDLTFDCTMDLSSDLYDPYSTLLGSPIVVDNCNYDLTVSVEDNTECGKSMMDPNNPGQYLYAYKRTFVASDGVGSSTCTQLIYVTDGDPFTENDIDWPDNIDVGCMESTDPDATGEPVLNEAACGLLAVSYDDTFFQYVDGVCAKILRTWTVLDWCQFDQNNPGQEGIWTYTQIIKVVDDIAPVLDCTDIVTTSCDADPNNPCDFYVSFDQPMVVDNCATYDTTINSETIITVVTDTMVSYYFDTLITFNFDTIIDFVFDSSFVVTADTVVDIEFECGMIDFELLPDGSTPFEGEMIGSQYQANFGITFMLEDGTTPQIAETGGVVANAFGSAWGNDELMPGEPIGSFFLTDDGMLTGLTTPALVVMWDNPIDSVAFGLMDIDFDEFFVMEAKDINGATIVLDTIFAGDPMTGDGVFTDWAVQLPTNNVRSLRVEGNRMEAGAFGFGMDNLSFCSTDTLGTSVVLDTTLIVDIDTLINIEIDTLFDITVDSTITIDVDSIVMVVNDTTITILGDFLFEYEIDLFCNGVIDISGEGDVTDNYHPIGEHKIIWTVTDACGNESSCIVPFVVADCKQPTPVCINGLSTVIMPNAGAVTIWAVDFESGSSFDNCTAAEDLLFSFSPDINHTSWTFTCDDIGLNEVQIWVTDLSGNTDYCTTTIFVGDNEEICDSIAPNPFMISTMTSIGEALPEVFVDADATQLTTNYDGYAFYASASEEINFSPKKNTNPLNGVSTLDLVAIQKHLLGINIFDNPYKYIAADVNNSTSVSAVDIIELRKTILGIYQDFPDNNSWRFVDADFIFNNPSQPWPFAEEIFVSENDMRMNIDFTAIKIGDVNGSATAELSNELKDRSSGIQLWTPEQKVSNDEVYNLPVYLSENNELLGMQFSLEAQSIEILSLSSGQFDISNSNYAVHENGSLTFSWNTHQSIAMNKDEALFFIKIQSNSDEFLSSTLKMNSSITAAEAFETEFTQRKVSLNFEQVGDENLISKNALFQNTPNPFSVQTEIGFELVKAGLVQINVYDAIGQKVFDHKAEYDSGKNNIILEKAIFKNGGIYFYELQSGDFYASKKMMFLTQE